MLLRWQLARYLLVLPVAITAVLAGLQRATASDAYSSAVLADSPAGYWRLDETTGTTAQDSSGHGNAGTIGSGVTLGQPGALVGSADTAMAFNGSTTGVITVSSLSGLTGGSHAFTAEAWVKLNTSVTSPAGVLAWGSNSNGQTNLWLSSTQVGDYYPVNTLLASNLGDLRGAWQHLVVTWDGTTRRVYLNTALIAQDTPTGVTMQLTNLTIGQILYPTSYPFNDSIDEVAIYDSALSPARIKAHYATAILSLPRAQAAEIISAQTVRPHECPCGDPVSSATGTYARSWTDLQLPGVGGGLALARSYRSTSSVPSPLGMGWSHPYLTRLRVDTNGTAYMILPDGRNVSFTRQTNATYLPPIPGMGTLVHLSNGTFTFTAKDRSVFTFDQNGNLTSLADRNGVTTTVTPDSRGRPATVTDAAGRTLQFSYNASGQLASVSGPDNEVVSYTYDGNGQLTSATLPGNLVWRYTPDSSGRINQVIDPDGIVQTANTYDSTGRVLSQTEAGGANQLSFTYDDTNHIVMVTDSAAQAITDHYDTSGNILSRTTSGGGVSSTWTYTYDTSGDRLTQTDPDNHTTTSTYDGDGNVLTRTDALNHTWTFTYDSQDHLLTAKDPRAGLTTNSYDTHGNLLTKVVSLDGSTSATTSYTTDSRGLVLSTINPDYAVTTYTYDTVGNLTQVKDALNRTTSMTYDARSRLASKTDALGAQMTYAYDGANRLTSQTLDTTGLALTTTYTYDGRGDLLSSTDPVQHTTSFTYTARSKVATQTDPLNHTTSFGYDAHGNRTSLTDPNNQTWRSAYDPLDRLLSSTDPLNGTQQFTHDAAGNRLSVTDQNNHQTTYAYDAGNQLIQVKDPAGGTTTYAHDGVGNRTSVTDPNNHTTTYTFDLAERLTAEADALGNIWQSVYDPAGYRTHLKDPKNQDTAFAYDAAGQLTKITDPLNGSVSFGYDAVSNRTSMTDPNTHTTSFAFDKVGRLTSETDPLNNVWQSSYDGVGHPIRLVDAKNQPTVLSYDAAGHLLQMTYADNSSVQYTYDPAGNRLTMVDPTGTTSWSYDALNRVTAIGQPTVGQVTYGYDAASNRTSIGLPGGTTVSYAYDAANRLASVTDGSQHTSSFGYDAAGNPTTANLSNGLQRRYTYDTANRLLGIEHWLGTTEVEGVDYTLNANGNRLTANELTAAPVGGGASLSRTVSYTYDALNRLTGGTYTDGSASESYAYDAAGNRLSATIGGTSTTSTYDAGNRLLTNGGDSYTYDANGNTLTAGARTYAWNAANRMVSVTLAPGATPITYAYNGGGALVSRGSQAQTTTYLQDFASSLPVVLRENGPSGQIDYTWAKGLLSQQDATGYYTVLADGLGSVRGLANAQGQAAGSFAYDSFGNPQGTPGGNATTNYHFAGEQADPATGLVNLRARSYDPHAGRFVSRDTHVQGGSGTQGFHRYAYVGDNPVGLTDPTGLDPECAAAAEATPPMYGAPAGVFAVCEVIIDGPRVGAAVLGTGALVAGAGVYVLDHREEIWTGITTSLPNCPWSDGTVQDPAPQSIPPVTYDQPGGNPSPDSGMLADPTYQPSVDLSIYQASQLGVSDLNEAQAANYTRYVKKLPAAANTPTIQQTPDGSIQFTSMVPARNIPGSYAVYQKTIDAAGNTTGYTLTTHAPDGSVVGVDDKLNP